MRSSSGSYRRRSAARLLWRRPPRTRWNTSSGFRVPSFSDGAVLALRRLHRRRRSERQLDDDGELAWPEVAFHPPLQFAHDRHVDETRPEPALAGRIDRLAEIL